MRLLNSTGLALLTAAALLSMNRGTAAPAPGADDAPLNYVEVPAQRSGVILFIGTEVKEGEKVPAELLITLKVGNQEKTYRRLREGDAVEKGQLLARLDDRLARVDLAIAQEKVTAAEAMLKASEKTRDEAQARYNALVQLQQKGAGLVAEGEIRAALLTLQRFETEVVSNRSNVDVARLTVKRAQIVLDIHEVRSPLRGTIKTILRRPGEAAKGLDPVLRIEPRDER